MELPARFPAFGRRELLPLCLRPTPLPLCLLPTPLPRALTPERMRAYTQCVMRDTARHTPARDYFVVEGAPQCTVGDQLMKKEIILQNLGWGHMPRFLIEDELRDGRLRSIAGRHFPGRVEELVVARRRDRPQGPVAQRLWEYLEAQAPQLRLALEPAPAVAKTRAKRGAGKH